MGWPPAGAQELTAHPIPDKDREPRSRPSSLNCGFGARTLHALGALHLEPCPQQGKAWPGKPRSSASVPGQPCLNWGSASCTPTGLHSSGSRHPHVSDGSDEG